MCSANENDKRNVRVEFKQHTQRKCIGMCDVCTLFEGSRDHRKINSLQEYFKACVGALIPLNNVFRLNNASFEKILRKNCNQWIIDLK